MISHRVFSATKPLVSAKFLVKLWILNRLVRVDHVHSFFFHSIIFEVVLYITFLIDVSFLIIILLIIYIYIYIYLFYSIFFCSLNLDQFIPFYGYINRSCLNIWPNHLKQLSLMFYFNI